MNQVGFIGLGKMGFPMAVQLLKSNYYVFGMDLNQQTMKQFQVLGGVPSTFEEIIHSTQYIILMLPSSRTVNTIIDSLLDIYQSGNLKSKPTIIDMSSSYPEDTRQNEQKLKALGLGFLDAPVSGGIKKAAEGTLTIMTGGKDSLFRECKPLLEAMGSKLFHVGPIGSGHLIKAVNNYLSAAHLLTTCETIHLLENYGVKPETAINVFNNSTGRSGSTEYKFPSFILNNSYQSGFSLELMSKDVKMASRLYEDIGAATAFPQAVCQKLEEAQHALPENADHTELFTYIATYLLTGRNSDEECKETDNRFTASCTNAQPRSL
ncbi:NAD(P)-dependent oxidoreductase [Fictibacillus enclensis]|uniref:NAD(P)-dependent oxidoreductase n=1 Tax=Fictibacillus enclensis TaxID=1017270 RepID=UPI0025A049E3|nr:NAD(P)-dependent oxidoreductase [Fictibacillus enclensis]MDM5200589.1 NAD(P)-dependent oxidoreductase [Fictibacillus enclensis]